MEQFKTRTQITEPDARQLPWVVRDDALGDWRRKTFDDHYRAIAQIDLAAGIPTLVQRTFTTARHLLLYSWYVYPFIVVAELEAMRCLEFALKWRIKEENTTRWGLKKCMKHGIAQGWLRDEGVRQAARARVGDVDLLEAIGLTKDKPLDESDPQAYVKLLAESLSDTRNRLAHGEPMLYPGGYATLGVIARMIDQLFARRPSHGSL